jgi:hypothetical protein
LAAIGPSDFLLNGNALRYQVLSPSVEALPFDSQREMSWAFGPMSRQDISLQGGLGQEGKQDVVRADLEENVAARLFANGSKAKNPPVKILGGILVIDINGGFDDCIDPQVRVVFRHFTT